MEQRYQYFVWEYNFDRGLLEIAGRATPSFLQAREGEGVALISSWKYFEVMLFSDTASWPRWKDSLKGDDIADTSEWLHIAVRIRIAERFIDNSHIEIDGHIAVVWLNALPRHMGFRCGR